MSFGEENMQYINNNESMFKRTAICTSLFVAFLSMGHIAVADTLNTINVTANSKSSIKGKKIGKTVKTAKDLSKQQVSDTKDLVRYETGVSVVEKGRMGASGYSIRGVDENRVAIMIDGLSQAETLSSQGFNELFAGYGNFNNTRNGVEVETVKQVEISKGSNSVEAGSGSLGGSVIFKTKDARDFLKGKDYYAGIKYGYSSRNNQHMVSTTLAGRYKMVDALAIYTYRDGHETENFGYPTYPDIPDRTAQGRARQKADPYHIKNHSLLTKFSINPNMDNRLTFAFDYNQKNAKGTDWSYTLGQLVTTTQSCERDPSLCVLAKEVRHTNDSSTRKNFSFAIENFNELPVWDSIKITASYQKVSQRAKTDEYCDGEGLCEGLENPFGVKLKDGKMVDKNGKPLKLGYAPKWVVKWDQTGNVKLVEEKGYQGAKTLALLDENGKELPYNENTDYGTKQDQNNLWGLETERILDCNAFDCSGTARFYHIENKDGELDNKQPDEVGYIDIDLTSKEPKEIIKEYETDGFDDNWNTIKVKKKEKTVFFVKDYQVGNKHYKKISAKETDWINKGDSFLDKNYEGWRSGLPGLNGWHADSDEYKMLWFSSRGYTKNWWKDRSLNTTLFQLKADMNKEFEIKSSQHQMAYGLSYDRKTKSMINYMGDDLINVQWWAQYFDTIDENGDPACTSNNIACSSKTDAETFLLPVVSNSFAAYVSDKIRFNKYANLDMKLRFDLVHHKPRFDPDKDPALPKGLYEGMYIDGDGPANMRYLANKQTRFMQLSYDLGVTIDALDWLRIQAKYAKGFRAPTSDELYFTFKHPDFSIIANPELKAEISCTKDIALTFHKGGSFLTLGAFRTDYKNFIELAFKGYHQFTSNGQTSGIAYRTYQNVNNSKAYVYGFNIGGRADFGSLTDKLKGFSLGYKLTYQKGQTYGIDYDVDLNESLIWHAINAISPLKQVVTFSYTAPEKKWGIDAYWTYSAAKKKEDTFDPYHGANANQFGAKDTGKYVANLSKAYHVFDVVGTYSPNKYINLKAGIYNLFNAKYATWESLRSIRSFGTSNLICKRANPNALGCKEVGQGMERFYAPGINFKFSAELKY